MNYSKNPSHVRVDRFKKSGKWYDTYMIDMCHYYDAIDLFKAVEDCFLTQYSYYKLKGFNLVCLEPYHKNSHPVMIIGPE